MCVLVTLLAARLQFGRDGKPFWVWTPTQPWEIPDLSSRVNRKSGCNEWLTKEADRRWRGYTHTATVDTVDAAEEPENVPHRLGNAQTNLVLLGGSGGQQLVQLIMASSQPERTQSVTAAHAWTLDNSQKSKAKPTLKSQKPKPGWGPRTRPREIVLCSAVWAVDTAGCALVSASSPTDARGRIGMSTRVPWRHVQ